ncbi:hypothetical protein JYK02_38540 [Corallococcus macrosporus]|uniref:Lipoprotein n=1 Tax=Corallococcus macrosporus TaxID=35 RepID=A0ABS3DQ30_9BACT|nr:hypothetical protein [Corallococcus macrosporus]MBN8233434.1 hypothetical protein [Corallococcus macrosporus]
MPVLKRPLSAFMLGACLFALSACDSDSNPTPDAGSGVDAGSDAGTDAGTEQPPPVIPEGHTLLTPSATELHTVSWEDAGAPLRFAFVAQAGHHYDLIVEAGSDGYSLEMRDGAGKSLDYGIPSRRVSSTPYAWHWSGFTAGAVHTVEVTWFSEYSEAPVAPFSFRFVDMGPDDHGDLYATATPWTPSEQVLTGSGEHWGERDLLSFQSVADNVYALECTFPTPYWDLSILNFRGQRYGVTDNTTFEETQAATAFKSPGGVFYASIKDQKDNTSTQPYTCVLKDMGKEDHGDSVQTATVLAAGTASVQAKFETFTDTDVFSLGVVSGHHYRVSCTIDGNKQCGVRTAAPGGEFVSPQGDRTRATFKASQSTHFVSVNTSPVVPTRWVEGRYTLQFEDLGADDHGDTLATATPLTGPTQAVSARILDPVDHDFFSFQATAGQRYQFACDWKDSPGQVQFHADFRDAQGNWVSYSREHVGARWVQTFEAQGSGTYGIDLWTDPTFTVLGDSTCQFDVLAP